MLKTTVIACLDHTLSSIGAVSNFTKHMWTHAKEQDFETKGDLHQWVRNNMEVSIQWKMSPISHMKTAATKQCRLCMKERVMLFNEYGRKAKPNSPRLLNSKDELHGACNCWTRFLRLYAVGNHGGADED